jgi:hypothetical protein
MDFLFATLFMGLSTLFWTATVISFLVLTALSEAEKYEKSLLLLAFVSVGLLYLGGSSATEAWNIVSASPLLILNYFALYVAVGLIYATIRWVWKIMSIRKKLIAFRIRKDIKGTLTDKQRQEFLGSIGMSTHLALPLKVSKNRGRIIYWMMFWPISLPITIRPINRLFSAIYNRIGNAFQSMSDYAFKDLV